MIARKFQKEPGESERERLSRNTETEIERESRLGCLPGSATPTLVAQDSAMPRQPQLGCSQTPCTGTKNRNHHDKRNVSHRRSLNRQQQQACPRRERTGDLENGEVHGQTADDTDHLRIGGEETSWSATRSRAHNTQSRGTEKNCMKGTNGTNEGD